MKEEISLKISDDNAYKKLFSELNKGIHEITFNKVENNTIECKDSNSLANLLELINVTIPSAEIRCMHCGIKLNIANGKKREIHLRANSGEGNHEVECEHYKVPRKTSAGPIKFYEGQTIMESLNKSTMAIENLIVLSLVENDKIKPKFATENRFKIKDAGRERSELGNIFAIKVNVDYIIKTLDQRRINDKNKCVINIKNIELSGKIWEMILVINESIKNDLLNSKNILNHTLVICINRTIIYKNNKKNIFWGFEEMEEANMKIF